MHKVLQVLKDSKVLKDSRDSVEFRVHKVLQVLKDSKVLKVSRDSVESRVHKVLKVLKVMMETLVVLLLITPLIQQSLIVTQEQVN